MKKFFLPIFAVLLVLGSILPLAAYRITRAVLSGAEPASSAVSSPAASAQPPSAVPSADAETFLVEDQATGQVLELSRQEYVLGAVAAEMPVSWPDEALKAQAVAAHSYALYCRDHTPLQSGAWLTADPARRQGCLTEPVLRSYWGTAYEQNYARLSALVDEVLDEILYYENAPACASYFAISNGQTEASENVWGSALPYLISVDSSTDRSADNYEYTVTFSAEQVQQALAGLGISADLAAPEGWFGPAALTSAGYTKTVTVCGQTVSGTTLRRALGLRSTCFTVQYQSGNFSFTTRGYGHGKVEYTVPEGTQSGTTFRLRGKGIQYLNGRGRGDMYVKCEVEIPKKLNKTQREALKKFEGTLKEENYEKRKGFFKKLKDMFNN